MKRFASLLIAVFLMIPLFAVSNGIADEITFPELTVVDNDECVIKITGIDPDNMFGYAVKVYVENKSADKTYMYSVENGAVNGLQSDPFWATEVAAGKKAKDEITFMDSDLKKSGIDRYTDIELSFRVYDSDDWMAADIAKTTVHVYPYGKENAVPFVREAQPTDNVILDNQYVTVTVTGYGYDDIWGYSAYLFLVNKTDGKVMFSVDDVSVNGFMVDPFWGTSVSAGKCAFSSISWLKSAFEENGITDVEEIELTFSARDYEDWMVDDYVEETILLKP